MAFNRSILGGSPLGLIGVRSYYDANGLSTFNAGKSRNIKVPDYNITSSSAGMLYGNSLFSGYRVVRAWPNVSTDDPKGLNDIDYINKKDKSKRRELHNNSVYDTSVLNIIEKLSGTKAQLRPADFAYLKNIGVYPNNRLMIARRFASPVDDNIMVPKKDSELSSFATLISWVPENENFLSFTFGEEWTDSEADFTNILTSLGQDVGLGNLGGISGAAGNILPLPGFTEIFQRNFLAKLGLIENDAKNSIPAGNPNLIKQSKRRKLVGYSDAGSGLKTTVNIKMTCEYELKYISGIDPTIVWMDLLGMITRFGTSNSETYGLSKSAGAKMITWANNPNQLISDAAQAISDAIKGIVDEIKAAIEKVYNAAKEANKSLSNTVNDNTQEKPAPISDQAAANKANEAQKTESLNVLKGIEGTIGKIGADIISGLLQKYRVKIIGVINSLTGLPSTPWHITVGNPMRPTFCSGDMLVEQVEVKLGPILAFNDLPSSISVEFNMTNARPWGLQEIMAKFNSGYLRTVDVQKSFYETNKVTGADNVTYNEPVGILPLNDFVYATASTTGSSGSSGVSGSSAGQSGTNANPSNSGTSGVVGTDSTTGNPVTASVDPNNVTKAEGGKQVDNATMNKDASQSILQKKSNQQNAK